MATNKLKFSSLLCVLTTLDSITKVTNLHSLYYRLCYQGNQSSFIHSLQHGLLWSERCLKDVWEADEMWAGYNFILFYMSTIPYLIVMGTGWALQIRAPENQHSHHYPYYFCCSIQVWYDWRMLLYLFSMLLFRLHVRRSWCNIRFHRRRNRSSWTL